MTTGQNQTDLRLLDPRQIRLERDPFHQLVLQIGYEERYQPVRVARALPISRPDEWIAFQDEEGEEIGMIARMRDLDPESRRLLQEELELTYLKATVQRILKVTSGHGMTTWELETDRGPRTVYVRDRSDIRPLPDGRVILTDVHGAKFEIPPAEQLDDRSRHWLEIEA